MRNTVVLKNISSNLVEEAIIVFKENVKIKEKQLVQGKQEENRDTCEKVALNEAQRVIVDYIAECEEEKKRNKQKVKMKVLKCINICLVVMLVFAVIF